jgi:perosamine synthetase
MACGAEYKGKKAGSFGDASIFSFGKAKAISTFDGGMLCTDNPGISGYIGSACGDFHYRSRRELFVKIVNSIVANLLTRPAAFFFTLYPVLKYLKMRDPYNPMEHRKDSLSILNQVPSSWKTRFANIQAAVGLEQLRTIERRNQKRIENAGILNEALRDVKEIEIVSTPPSVKNIHLYYPVFIKGEFDINKIRRVLIKFGVDSQLNELTTPQQLEIFGATPRDYPVFNEISHRLLVIPNGIYLTGEDARYVASTFKRVMALTGQK